ncbi:MAG: hypothetical protein R6W83_11945 [Cryobacterium sp.]
MHEGAVAQARSTAVVQATAVRRPIAGDPDVDQIQLALVEDPASDIVQRPLADRHTMQQQRSTNLHVQDAVTLALLARECSLDHDLAFSLVLDHESANHVEITRFIRVLARANDFQAIDPRLGEADDLRSVAVVGGTHRLTQADLAAGKPLQIGHSDTGTRIGKPIALHVYHDRRGGERRVGRLPQGARREAGQGDQRCAKAREGRLQPRTTR